MTIRSRLLLILLPGLILIIATGSWFLHYRWSSEIMATHHSRLATVATSCAQMIDANDHSWIDQHRDNPQVTKSRRYQHYHGLLTKIRESLPLSGLYTVRLKPVQKGDPVLLNLPISTRNPVCDGCNPSLAYRKVYVLDGGSRTSKNSAFDRVRTPGDYDFCQNGEHCIYYTKETMVSPIYTSMRNGNQMMTAYAPILDKSGHVTALVGAEVTLDAIKPELQRAMAIIVAAGLSVILLAISSVYLFANKISSPLKTLGDSALAIAGGEYGRSVTVCGPSELVELANTLNTMSGCLEEHLTAIKEDSLLRERQYGERESCALLQQNLLDKVVAEWNSKRLQLSLYSFIDHTIPIGCKLSAKEEKGAISLSLLQAKDPGFDAMYELANTDAPVPFQGYRLDSDNTLHIPDCSQNSMLVWVASTKQLTIPSVSQPLQIGDVIIIGNHAFKALLQECTDVTTWLQRLFETFADDGPAAAIEAITKELDQLLRDGRTPPPGGVNLVMAWTSE